MTDYKYATEWLDYVSKSPPEEHGGFDLTTITGATTSLREILRLKRENAQYRRWLKVLVNPMSIATRIKTWREIRSKEPDLFKTKKRGSK